MLAEKKYKTHKFYKNNVQKRHILHHTYATHKCDSQVLQEQHIHKRHKCFKNNAQMRHANT